MRSPDNGLLPRHFPGGLLRRLRPDDLVSFQSYRSIAELGQYQGWSSMSEAEAGAFLGHMSTAPLFSPGKWIQLGIAEPVAERLIGDIGILLAGNGCTAEIGFTLEPNFQGRGIATAAVRAAIQLLFASTKAREVLGITDHRNLASIRLLERAGFQYRQSHETVFRGEPCSEKVYALARNVG